MTYTDAILSALSESGRSDREVSIAAVGHESAVRSVRRGLDLRGSTIEALCKALDLEFYIGPPRAEPERKEDPEWITLLLDTLEEHHRGLREDLKEELLRLLREDYQKRSEPTLKMVAEDRPKEGFGKK